MKISWIYILLAFLWITPLHAQTGQREDISDLLDDGGVSQGNNLIKFNVFNALAGDLSLAYERKLSNRFTIQANVGKVVPFFLVDLSGLLTDIALADPRQDLSNLAGGYSFGITPKYYIRGNAPDLYYLGLDYQYRRYNRDINYDLVFTDYQILSGYHLLFGTRFVFELYGGLGVRQIQYLAHRGTVDLSVLNGIVPNIAGGLRIGVVL